MTTAKREFPFGIMDVASMLGIHIRRPGPDSVYADCPFCGDKRGKLNLNLAKDVFRCNYCDKHGWMLDLYVMAHGGSRSEAYREVADAKGRGAIRSIAKDKAVQLRPALAPVQSQLAKIGDIHKTLAALFELLPLEECHRQNLRRRGLTDRQIVAQGYKSTPAPHLSREMTERLIEAGCVVQGVPGFYVDSGGKWTFRLSKRIAGFFIPIRGINGLYRGAQIRLDVPIKDKDADENDEGTKYIWFSSASKKMGVSSGSPVHYIGDAFARTVYVTEGALKGNVAHSLMKRSFACIAGANNWRQLDPLFALLAKNGTELIIEAHDMDKYRNSAVDNGAARICEIARKHGMETRRLTWDPNHKGIDNWQLALKKKAMGGGTEALPLSQRKRRCFRIYQMEFTAECPTRPFAYRGMDALRKAGYEDPPAAYYRLVHDGQIFCPFGLTAAEELALIAARHRLMLPSGYMGRSVAASDVLELYDGEERRYFYCGDKDFTEVSFLPELAMPMNGTML